jgi:hypothetical protein
MDFFGAAQNPILPAAEDDDSLQLPTMQLHLERHSSNNLIDMESGVSPKYTKQLAAVVSSGDLEACKKEFSAPMAHEMSSEKDGRSPLTIAIIAGHMHIAKWLVLDKQAMVNARDIDGATPLHWAIIQGEDEMAHWLAERGANATETDFKVRPVLIPLSWAPLICCVLACLTRLAYITG